MRFVETPIFLAQITAELDDLSYRKLQLATPAQVRILRRLVEEQFK